MSVRSHGPVSITGQQHQRRTAGTKRTREEAEETPDIDRRPFTIKDPSEPFARPRTFTPISLLSRAQLPLAFLDTAQPGSRLFSAHIHILESLRKHGDGETNVLVAQEEKEKRVYAIERVQSRTYALCRLGEWVKQDELKQKSQSYSQASEPKVKRQALRTVESGQPWWTSAAVEPPAYAGQKHVDDEVLPKLNMERQSASATSQQMDPDIPKPVDDIDMQETLESVKVELSPQDNMQELSRQYMEALYLSRMSLAYFTKGPLSRARAAFSSQSAESETSALIEFLRQSILSSTVMDKKYRDTVPALVQDLPVRSPESPDQQPKKGKKKRKFKPKRDKAGFFVEEQDFVERWWRVEDTVGAGPSFAETKDSAIRRRLPRIRSRETFLQLTLVLEVLALETLAGTQPQKTNDASTAPETQEAETQGEGSQAAHETKKSRPKKKQDLPALLETLLDKLCIWHSLETHSPARTRTDDKQEAEEGTNDELKSFCIEVIMPFFASRIPQYATIVNKKLGGPSAPSPVKRRSTSSRKPGEPAVRQAPEKKPRQPLSRVSTDTLNQSEKRAPTLQRSSTDTETLAHIKREGSEVPFLNSIPPAKPQRRSAVSRPPRASLMQQMSFSKREVDLSAMSQANEAKMRKKADVEEKLRDAISTLKKPNRTAAVKEIADSTDESFAKALAKGKPSSAAHQSQHRPTKATKETAESSSKSLPHVAATPKHRRGVVKATPYKHGGTSSTLVAHHEAHSSGGTSLSYVPSSSARFLARPDEQAPPSTFAVPQTGHRPRHTNNVEDTPSRGFAKFMPRGLAREPGTLESPVANRTSAAIQQTPTKPARPMMAFSGADEVAATPLRPSSTKRAGERQREESVERQPQQQQPQNSIYDALGWDDEYEELS